MITFVHIPKASQKSLGNGGLFHKKKWKVFYSWEKHRLQPLSLCCTNNESQTSTTERNREGKTELHSMIKECAHMHFAMEPKTFYFLATATVLCISKKTVQLFR